MIDLTKEDKRIIKIICAVFDAQGIWIDDEKVNLPTIEQKWPFNERSKKEAPLPETCLSVKFGSESGTF